jgi:iron complex transport system permease protein
VLVPILLLLALLVIASLAVGARHVSAQTLYDAWFHFDPSNGDQVIVRARLPRTVAGLLVGGALGLAGAAMQAVARNPLADPGILGVNAGAALAVVVALAVFGLSGISAYVWFALLGAALAAVVVYGVASLGREGATPVKLALAGAAMSAGLASLTNGLLVTSRQTLDGYRSWQIGSVGLHDWHAIRSTAPFLVVGILVTLGTGRLLNGLALGDDVARGLGQRVGLGRAVTALGVVVLCGAATALAGPIAFVGLVVPHAVRALVGGDNRWVLPLSLLLAPVLVVGADVVGRVILPPAEVAAGISTAVIGAPFFIWLVRRRRVPGW